MGAEEGARRGLRQKQLLFDRRYGWVYEEWTDPVEVANIGGRGMFSVVPIAAAALDQTLRLANLAADSVARALLQARGSRSGMVHAPDETAPGQEPRVEHPDARLSP